MGTKITNKTGTTLKIEMEIELDSNSMLNSEEQIALSLNEAGLLATKEALELFDTKGEPIEVKGKLLTSKGRQKKTIKLPTENKK